MKLLPIGPKLTSQGSSLQGSLSRGFSLASHSPSATISLVAPNVHMTVRVFWPPPQDVEQSPHGPVVHMYPSPPWGVSLMLPEGMLYSNSTPGFSSWYSIWKRGDTVHCLNNTKKGMFRLGSLYLPQCIKVQWWGPTSWFVLEQTWLRVDLAFRPKNLWLFFRNVQLYQQPRNHLENLSSNFRLCNNLLRCYVEPNNCWKLSSAKYVRYRRKGQD